MKSEMKRITPRPWITAIGISVLLVLVAHSALSTNYYVEVTGTDSVTVAGISLTNAWRTVGYALLNSGPNDTIHIGAGTFPEWVVISNAVTLSGSDLYLPANPPLQRHQSLTVLTPPTNIYPDSPFVNVQTGNVRLLNLTVNGDADGNGTADAKIGVYSLHRPLIVSNCVLANLNGFGIQIGNPTISPPSASNDTDSLRSYFGYTMIANIAHPTSVLASGIFMERTPATVERNEIVDVNGTNAYAGLYVWSCFYTGGMTQPVTARYNYFENCKQAIWANDFGAPGEKLVLCNNTIVDSQIGIRVTAAQGQTVITNNSIQVEGATQSLTPTPAKAIWIQADQDPWNPTSATLHTVSRNTLTGSGTNTDTVGLLMEYDTSTWLDHNNGVRATVSSNVVFGFGYGAYLESGSNGVSVPTNRLVDVTFRHNDFSESIHYSIFTTGISWTIDATTNWLGTPVNPSNMLSGPINYTGYQSAPILGANPPSILSVDSFSLLPSSAAYLGWIGRVGQYYKVLRSTNLVAGNWTTLTNRMPATPPHNTFTDTTSSGLNPAFYRLTSTNQ